MKQALTLYSVILIIALAGMLSLGPAQMVLVGHGAVSILALLISGTFLWLWQVRATPLALGMSFSWAGLGLTLGWWWAIQLRMSVDWGLEAAVLFFFLSLLMAGAVLHFAVIQGSFGFHGMSFLVPVLGAVMLSLGVLLVL
ncbi:hypothetical protein EDD53_0298 [Pacificibacter maritimus]|uniref:Uncharacterized protein n=1 Tax=Pacificibacter maritimus TaxID=762213 RepID=A0A3N4VE17_9RHOB|nr:hypothetical protein [Pacificibacter maritimus]RPE71184.1 hypothetical protein EDD53_0298 [Pacificibacter maritimus]